MTGGGRLFRHLGTSFVFLGSAAWLAAVVGWFRGVRRVPVLREVGMGETLRSLLDQDYPGWLEVLAVDDCSTDRTGEIIVGLAAERPERLRTLRVDLLPEDWLGKNHALYRGAEESGGEWLLFTDADVSFSPDCIKYAIHYALRENLDHLTFSPELIPWGSP